MTDAGDCESVFANIFIRRDYGKMYDYEFRSIGVQMFVLCNNKSYEMKIKLIRTSIFNNYPLSRWRPGIDTALKCRFNYQLCSVFLTISRWQDSQKIFFTVKYLNRIFQLSVASSSDSFPSSVASPRQNELQLLGIVWLFHCSHFKLQRGRLLHF